MRQKALSLIREEHRALASVLEAMTQIVRQVARTGKEPDFRLMHAMLFYLREFPERRHHHSEDASLFALLMQRTDEADEVIHQLQAEHDRGEHMLNMLTVALSTWEAGRLDGAVLFSDALKRFSEFYWRHMGREENEVLPIAERKLSDEDWEEVHRTFSGHADPLIGKHENDELDELFSEIVLLAPAPIGLGGGDS